MTMFQDGHITLKISNNTLPAGNIEHDMCSDIGFLVAVMHFMNGAVTLDEYINK